MRPPDGALETCKQRRNKLMALWHRQAYIYRAAPVPDGTYGSPHNPVATRRARLPRGPFVVSTSSRVGDARHTFAPPGTPAARRTREPMDIAPKDEGIAGFEFDS